VFSKSARSSRVAADGLQNAIREVRIVEISNYEILPWSDIAVDRPEQLVKSITSFFDPKKSNPSVTTLAVRNGRVGNINYNIKGIGPALILLPFSLSSKQWGPVTAALSQHFTVITASGPQLGFVPVLENRASLPTYQNMLTSLISMMDIKPNGRVLELGCGTGILSRQALALRSDLAITSADTNGYLLKEGSSIAKDNGIKVNCYFEDEVFSEANYANCGELNFTYGDATNISFPDKFFDAVFSVTVLEECDAEAALSEINRILKPGGVAGIVVRAIDLRQWWNVDVSEELFAQISIPPQLVGAKGIADKSLYAKMGDAEFEDLVCYPYLFSASKNRDESLYSWYRQRTRQNLSDDHQIEFDRAIEHTKYDATLVYSHPLHCCIGWKYQ